MRSMYNISGVDSIKDIVEVKPFYRFKLNSNIYLIDYEFIKMRFIAMKFDKFQTYFAYLDDILLNGVFMAIGTCDTLSYDYELIEVTN